MMVDIRLMLYLTLTFIVMTVVGTLTHELGHHAVAKSLGYTSRINYKATFPRDVVTERKIADFYQRYYKEIQSGQDFPEQADFKKLVETRHRNWFWITLGGPVQTMLTGSIGLTLLILYRKKLIKENKVSLLAWVVIFMSLLWLHQLANLFMGLIGLLSNRPKSSRGDELNLANYLQIPTWSIAIGSGLISIMVLYYVLRLYLRISGRHLLYPD